MCRSIKVLRTPVGQPTDMEIREAALQFVRKISGYRHPSQANIAVFQAAVDDIASASKTLLVSLIQKAPPQRPHEGAVRK
ncbi:MAG: DUF2277 domain-containing protein [Chloroflexi bacterium]|nr:DUF2277 domain-containing protein [Chloroflexota bacterium]